MRLNLETMARIIADAGAGLHPMSVVREAIYHEALKQLRAATGSPAFYSDPNSRTAEAERN